MVKDTPMNRDLTVTFSPSGNVFVIAAIVMEKGLQNVANYLIVSLAVADLMVACLVMPLGAMYEVRTGQGMASGFKWTNAAR